MKGAVGGAGAERRTRATVLGFTAGATEMSGMRSHERHTADWLNQHNSQSMTIKCFHEYLMF